MRKLHHLLIISLTVLISFSCSDNDDNDDNVPKHPDYYKYTVNMASYGLKQDVKKLTVNHYAQIAWDDETQAIRKGTPKDSNEIFFDRNGVLTSFITYKWDYQKSDYVVNADLQVEYDNQYRITSFKVRKYDSYAFSVPRSHSTTVVTEYDDAKGMATEYLYRGENDKNYPAYRTEYPLNKEGANDKDFYEDFLYPEIRNLRIEPNTKPIIEGIYRAYQEIDPKGNLTLKYSSFDETDEQGNKLKLIQDYVEQSIDYYDGTSSRDKSKVEDNLVSRPSYKAFSIKDRIDAPQYGKVNTITTYSYSEYNLQWDNENKEVIKKEIPESSKCEIYDAKGIHIEQINIDSDQHKNHIYTKYDSKLRITYTLNVSSTNYETLIKYDDKKKQAEIIHFTWDQGGSKPNRPLQKTIQNLDKDGFIDMNYAQYQIYNHTRSEKLDQEFDHNFHYKIENYQKTDKQGNWIEKTQICYLLGGNDNIIRTNIISYEERKITYFK